GLQLGLAPLDVIVGRFVRAICCLSGQPVLLPPQLPPDPIEPSHGYDRGIDVDHAFTIGNPISIEVFSHQVEKPLKWVANNELLLRMVGALLGDPQDQQELVATRLRDGGSIAFVLPAEGGGGGGGGGTSGPPQAGGGGQKGTSPRVVDDLTQLLRRG